MRPSFIVLMPFALIACSSNNLGGRTDGAQADAEIPADTGMPDQQTHDSGPACGGQTPPTCYSSDCTTALGTAPCTDGVFRCPQGQISYFECFGGDCPVSPPPPKVCRDANGGIVSKLCSAGITYCPPGTTMIGPDAGTDGGITCNGEASCYSSDCTSIVSCSDVGLCPGTQLLWSQCFGTDGAADR